MTHKEIAQLLRDMSNRIGSLTRASFAELADELAPPRPAPGTVVWWRWDDMPDWHIGQVSEDGKGIAWRIFSWDKHVASWDHIEWKPARIAGPGQVIVAAEDYNRLREALEWYEKIVGECNRRGREGDDARNAIAQDMGKRARTALQEVK